MAVPPAAAEVMVLTLLPSHGAISNPTQLLPRASMMMRPVPLFMPTPSRRRMPAPILLTREPVPRMMMSPPPEKSRTLSVLNASAPNRIPLDQPESEESPHANPSGIPSGSPLGPPSISRPPAITILPPPDSPNAPIPAT